MFAKVLISDLLHGTVLPVMGPALAAGNQLDFVARLDTVAAAVIGVIVVGAAVFALMCRYR
jgi:hypothetical protein